MFKEYNILKLFVDQLNLWTFKYDLKSYFETFSESKILKCEIIPNREGNFRNSGVVTLLDYSKGIIFIYNKLDKELRNKILNMVHEINGKIVDVQLYNDQKTKISNTIYPNNCFCHSKYTNEYLNYINSKQILDDKLKKSFLSFRCVKHTDSFMLGPDKDSIGIKFSSLLNQEVENERIYILNRKRKRN